MSVGALDELDDLGALGELGEETTAGDAGDVVAGPATPLLEQPLADSTTTDATVISQPACAHFHLDVDPPRNDIDDRTDAKAISDLVSPAGTDDATNSGRAGETLVSGGRVGAGREPASSAGEFGRPEHAVISIGGRSEAEQRWMRMTVSVQGTGSRRRG